MKKQIFVVDLVWTGHIPSFHKMIIKGFLDLGFPVCSLSPNPTAVHEYIKGEKPNLLTKLNCLLFSEKSLVKPFAQRVIQRFAHKSAFLRNKYFINHSKALWTHARNLVRANKKSDDILVFFPYINYGFYHKHLSADWIEQNFPYNWAALDITPNNLSDVRESFYGAKSCQSLSILDERFLGELYKNLNIPIYLFPEIVHENTSTISTKLTADILNKANGRKIIVLAGIIASSKKLITLLETAKIYEKDENTPFFVVVGEFFLNSWSAPNQNRVEKLIREAGNNVFTHLHRIESEGEFNKLYELSDIIFGVYHQFDKSSNTLSKASLFKKPILVAEGKYLIAKRVEQFNLGRTIDENSADSCMRAIESIFALSEEEMKQFGYEEYLAKNGQSKLKEVLKKISLTNQQLLPA